MPEYAEIIQYYLKLNGFDSKMPDLSAYINTHYTPELAAYEIIESHTDKKPISTWLMRATWRGEMFTKGEINISFYEINDFVWTDTVHGWVKGVVKLNNIDMLMLNIGNDRLGFVAPDSVKMFSPHDIDQASD